MHQRPVARVLKKVIISRANGRAQLIWVAGNVPIQLTRVTVVEPFAVIVVWAVRRIGEGNGVVVHAVEQARGDPGRPVVNVVFRDVSFERGLARAQVACKKRLIEQCGCRNTRPTERG